MKAVIKKCLQPNVLLPKLTEYIRIFQENVVTNLNVSNMAYFAKSAVGGLDMDSVEFITMPWKDAGDGAHVLPVAGELLEAINAHFNPYLEDIRPGELKIVTSIGSSSGGPFASTNFGHNSFLPNKVTVISALHSGISLINNFPVLPLDRKSTRLNSSHRL